MRKLCLLVFVGSLSAQNNYLIHNLVSDVSGMADHVDPNLVSPWGNAFSSGSPFWVANNGTGTSTLYDDTGALFPLVVNIPAAAGASTPGKVTGVIFNGNANSFLISGQTPPFIFCSEDGTITGWSLAAEVQFAGVSEAGLYQFNVVVPKGLTPGTTPNIDVPVVIDLGGGAKTQSNAVISVAAGQ